MADHVQDDFTQLNEKFIKARRDYESLLETSMVQPASSAYGRSGYPSYGGGYPQQGMLPPQNDPTRYYTPGPQGKLRNLWECCLTYQRRETKSTITSAIFSL